MGNDQTFWPFSMAQNLFWPAMRFELCTPDLEHNNILVLFKQKQFYFIGLPPFDLFGQIRFHRYYFVIFTFKRKV